MNIEREWRREAIVWLNGEWALASLVSDFIRRRSDPRSPLHVNRDDIVDWCAEAGSLTAAITRACASLRPNGKLHNHQSRVSAEARGRLTARMVMDTRQIKCERTFEALHDRIVGYGEFGIGPVTAYDVATRVGAYLGLEPQKLHLHAGCRAGLRALSQSPSPWNLTPAQLRGEYLDPALLPSALTRKLKVDEIEDFLCVYREVLGKVTS